MKIRSEVQVGNPIRDVGFKAAEVAKQYELPVIAMHLGNPGHERTSGVGEAMLESVKNREPGYGPHHGTPENREQMAKAISKIEGIKFSGADVLFAPGATSVTTALNATLLEPGDRVLLSKPGYGTYYLQVATAHGQPVGYALNEKGLITFAELDGKIAEAPDRVKLININYPHNPTGKTLSKEEAAQVAGVLNKIAEKYQDIVFYNDAVYCATATSETGYHSILPHLSPEALQRTVSGFSGSKFPGNLAGERIAATASNNQELTKAIANALSQGMAGPSAHSEKALVAAAQEMTKAKVSDKNPAAFYSERRKIVAEAFSGINEKLQAAGTKGGVEGNDTGGSMFVWAKFGSLLKGKAVPEKVQGVVGSATFESGEHLMKYMLALPELGYTPVSTCNGEIFRAEAAEMALRISCVSKDLWMIKEAMNSFKGALQEALGVDLGAVKASSLEELKDKIKNDPEKLQAEKAAKSAERLKALSSDGKASATTRWKRL